MGSYTILLPWRLNRWVSTGIARCEGRQGGSPSENQTLCHKSINSALSHAGEVLSAINIDIQLSKTDANKMLIKLMPKTCIHSITEMNTFI